MARSNFKRNYDNGTVTLPDGREVNVVELPATSLNYFAVYGFIRACQDPTGGEKDEVKREKDQIVIAEALIAGNHDKKTRTFGANLEDKLDEANANLQRYAAASDADKRFAATLGINRSTYTAEIARLEKVIAKRDAKAAETKKGLAKIDAAVTAAEQDEYTEGENENENPTEG